MASHAEISTSASTLARVQGSSTTKHPSTLHMEVSLILKSQIQACTSVRSIIAATPMGHKRGAAAPKIVRWCSFSIPFEKRIGMIVGHKRTPPKRRGGPPSRQENSSGNVVCLRCSIWRKEEKGRKLENFGENLWVGARWGLVGLVVSHTPTSWLRHGLHQSSRLWGGDGPRGRELAGCLACGHWIGAGGPALEAA